MSSSRALCLTGHDPHRQTAPGHTVCHGCRTHDAGLDEALRRDDGRFADHRNRAPGRRGGAAGA